MEADKVESVGEITGGLSPASSEQDAAPPESWPGFMDPGEMGEDESSEGGDSTDPASQEFYNGGTAENEEFEAAVARGARNTHPPEVPAFVGYCGMGAVLGASVVMTNPPTGLGDEDLALFMFFFFVLFLFGLGLIMSRVK
ncbi:hypothetical protein KSP39_PZI023157 [Platanthera zijinensis]|uniref:Uncharacterized protein n=1 Tax=Platanthera zijinensis TaxID=2320716 RepID=A0AAP0AW36_9ASPA